MVTEMFQAFKGISSSTPSGSAAVPTVTHHEGEQLSNVETTKEVETEDVKIEPKHQPHVTRPIPIIIVRPLTKHAPELEMIGSSSRIQLTDTILEVLIPQPIGPIIDITPPEQPESLPAAPKSDRGKGKFTNDKRDKTATLHNEGLKNCLQKVETASGFLTTPSGITSDGVKTLATALECCRPKETLEDSASQDKEDYSTCS
ncbi:hypothetical protein Tco_1485200 [Tanacetum coccineum]